MHVRVFWVLITACAAVALAGAPTMTNLNPATRPSARTGAGMAVIPGSGNERFVLFGGNAGLSGASNQTWIYDVAANTWTQVTPATSPLSRAWGNLTWDTQYQRAVLFGGSRDLNGPLLNDVHLFDPATSTWQALTTPPDAGPSPRFLSNMVYVPTIQAHLLFAGGTSTSNNAEATVLTNELWRLTVTPDAGLASWTRLTPGGTPAPARASACAGYDPVRRRLLVFGGEIINDTIADLVEYDVMSNAWVSGAPVGGTAPTKRGSAVCTFDVRAGKLFVYGGVTQVSGTPIGEAWTFEPGARQWTRITPMPSAGNNTFGAPVFSTQLGGMAFFGGRTSLIGTSQATWWGRLNANPVVAPMGNASAPEAAMDLRAAPTVMDPDGDPLTYLWVQVGGPDAGITNANTATPTIATPRVVALTPLTYSVLVSDGFDTADAGFDLLVQDTINEPPIADAGPDRVVDGGVQVSVDGRGSSDPNGELLTFTWAQVAGTPVTVQSAGSQAAFTSPAGPTTVRIQLTVTDPRMGVGTTSVLFTVLGADAGAGGGSAGGAGGGMVMLGGGAGGGSAGGAGAGPVAGGSAGGAAGGAAGGVAGGASGAGGSAGGGAAGGSAGGAAGGGSGGGGVPDGGDPDGGVGGGAAAGGAAAGGSASGGSAAGGAAAGGAAAGGAAAGGAVAGGSAAGGAAGDGGSAPGDAGEVDPRLGPEKSFGVGCGCTSFEGPLWLFAAAAILGRRRRRG